MSDEPMELVDRGDGTFYAPVAGYYKLPPVTSPDPDFVSIGDLKLWVRNQLLND